MEVINSLKSNKKRIGLIINLLILIIGLIPSFISTFWVNDNHPYTIQNLKITDPVGTPIEINNNTDFVIQANLYGWTGEGTKDKPYVIENLTIVTTLANTNAFRIENTTVHFVIRNCTVTTSSGDGFRLRYVSNAMLENNTSIDNGHGIYMFGCNNNIMTNNFIQNSYDGLFIYNSYNNSIINNTIQNSNDDGFILEYSFNNSLINNTSRNNIDDGFSITSSFNNTIINNTLINNGFVVVCDSLESVVQHSVIGNTVNGKPLVFLQHKTNEMIDVSAGQIILINSSFIHIQNQVISSPCTAFQLFFSHNNTLINNTAQNNSKHGFELYGSSNNTLTNNTAQDNNAGFKLEGSSFNVLFNNSVKANVNGFHLYESDTNTLINNTSESNYDGFYLAASEFNTLTDNTAKINSDVGFKLLGSSNTIILNNLAQNNNWYGVELRYSNYNSLTNNSIQENSKYGILLERGSQSNMIMFNALYSNNEDGVQASSESSNNSFYYNYWSDHTVPDINADGIIDEPYEIDGTGNCRDDYSVTKPHSLYIPTVPLSLQAIAGNSEVTLKWAAPISNGGSRITRYKIYRSTTSSADYTYVGDTSTTTFIDKGLTNGITYYYVVRAVNDVGESGNSNEISVTPITSKKSTTSTITKPSQINGFDLLMAILTLNLLYWFTHKNRK